MPAEDRTIMVVYDGTDLAAKKQSHRFASLPHPANGGEAAAFLLPASPGGSVLEITRAAPLDCSSFFIDDSVHSDGTLAMASPVDPLFLLLPTLLQAAASNSSLSDLPSILPPPLLNLVQGEGEEGPGNEAALAVLKAVCETSEVGDEMFYRVSEDKVLAYLCKRAETLADFFVRAAEDSTSYSLDSLIRPGVSSSFRGVASADALSKGALAAAVDLICEYLPEAWRKKLRDAKDVVQLVETPKAAPAAAKPGKSYETDEQVEEAQNLIAASKRGRSAPDRLSKDELAAMQADRVRKRAKEAREAEKQRKIEVANRGTPSISSFFKPKAKGKGKSK